MYGRYINPRGPLGLLYLIITAEAHLEQDLGSLLTWEAAGGGGGGLCSCSSTSFPITKHISLQFSLTESF